MALSWVLLYYVTFMWSVLVCIGMLSVTTLNDFYTDCFTLYCYAGCRYAKWRYAECRYDKWRLCLALLLCNGKLIVDVLNAGMLDIAMLNAAMQSVVKQGDVYAECRGALFTCLYRTLAWEA